MTNDKLYINGELFLSLETVAELYQIKHVWLMEVCEQGLLSSERDSRSTLCIAAIEMDRVATIVRMHAVLGLDLETIALTLASE